jgi:hypothetical protein
MTSHKDEIIELTLEKCKKFKEFTRGKQNNAESYLTVTISCIMRQFWRSCKNHQELKERYAKLIKNRSG